MEKIIPAVKFEAGAESLAGVAPQLRTLSADDRLFRQGDEPFAIFRLLAGQIKLVRVTPDGTDVPMHTARPGELFAEAALFSLRYHCDAIATRPSVVLAFPTAELASRLRQHPEEMWNMAAVMARQVQGLRTRLEIRHVRSAPLRVLQALRLRSDEEGRWQQSGTLKLFAEELGLTHEAFYRALAKLERDGRITRAPGEIRIRPGAGPR